MPTPKGSPSITTGNYTWEWPDPTASELRRFVERDCGKYLVNALRDVGMALGFIAFVDDCPPISVWSGHAEGWTAIPEEVKGRLSHIGEARFVASSKFPSLNRVELDAARVDIVNVMAWLRKEFPAAGVEYLPPDFGS